MTEENKEIETADMTDNKEKNWCKRRLFVPCMLCILLLFISIFCCACTNNGSFHVLENAYGYSAVPLNENEIFLAAEYDKKKLLPAQIYNIKKRKFKSLNSYLNVPRFSYNAVNLEDGRILIFGGIEENGYESKAAEIYNIETNVFTKIMDSNFPNHCTVTNHAKLKDGRFFIITEGRAEIFDPKTNQFTIAGKITDYYQKSVNDKNGEKKRQRTTKNIYERKTAIALLQDGRVLILGPNYNMAPNNAEIYNPETNSFEITGSQNFPMFYRDAVTLQDGRVLVTGGTKQYYSESVLSEVKANGAVWSADEEIQGNNAEIFDPKTNQFKAIYPLKIARQDHKSILLSNGKVLIVHGTNNRFLKSKNTKRAELFDPKTNKFELASSSDVGWYLFNAVPLNEHTILLTSFYRWEIYKY